MLQLRTSFCYIARYINQTYRKMSTLAKSMSVPLKVRGMKSLDRTKFNCDVRVPVLKVSEENISKVLPICKQYILKLENFKPVQTVEHNGRQEKCINLNPDKITAWNDFPEEYRQKLSELRLTSSNMDFNIIQIGYNNWKYEQIFKAVLPEGEEAVSGFSQIGHIIHLNLRDHLLDYKFLIGEVLLDKIKTCKTVVNKSNIIDTTYRNFSMELLAGENDYLVTVRENRCNFQFDFSKVYWNPRLGKEHERILSFLKANDILFDVFCGVGPFAIPAAKKKCFVYANDLNPESFKWLNHNATSNKVDKKLLQSYNIDGKEFICNIFKNYLLSLCKEKKELEGSTIHVTMNLPALAVEFLSNFNGLLDENLYFEKFNYKIVIYVYCFIVGDDMANIIELTKETVCKHIGANVISNIKDVFNVRNVSPKKEMMRVTIELTKEVLFNKCNSECEPPSKKLCIDIN